MPLGIQRPHAAMLVLYGCAAVGLVLALIGVLAAKPHFWLAGFIVCGVAGIGQYVVRWRLSRRTPPQ